MQQCMFGREDPRATLSHWIYYDHDDDNDDDDYDYDDDDDRASLVPNNGRSSTIYRAPF